jgi:Arc/MetJ-type ribon-helix-helix transcriptional regulator
MRTTKVIAFSVPPDFENQILKHAKSEHRTVSEYIREAVRHYMTLSRFNATQHSVSTKMKRRGIKRSDVDEAITEVRKRSR